MRNLVWSRDYWLILFNFCPGYWLNMLNTHIWLILKELFWNHFTIGLYFFALTIFQTVIPMYFEICILWRWNCFSCMFLAVKFCFARSNVCFRAFHCCIQSFFCQCGCVKTLVALLALVPFLLLLFFLLFCCAWIDWSSPTKSCHRHIHSHTLSLKDAIRNLPYCLICLCVQHTHHCSQSWRAWARSWTCRHSWRSWS